MNLKDFLADCENEKIINQSTVDQIYSHYLLRKEQIATKEQTKQNQARNSNGLNITVGIIGVVLVGFGIIYLFAHNWDTLSRTNKTVLSLIPVILSILANVFTLTKRKESVVWQESTAISTFLAVGSMLALILQIYQLPGIENYFYSYWCVLCIPVIYLLSSHCAVFCAMILMLLNLTSNPMDQSTLLKIPWFGSFLLFLTLVPYLKRLFTLRKPHGLFVAHQVALPFVVCLTIITNVYGTHSSIWLIIFLLLANFHLFGTSIFLRKEDRTPNLISILSYIGVSLSLTYLLFNKSWNFSDIMNVESNDYRLLFIPILFVLGISQLVLFFRKEKWSVDHAHKLIILFPIPFVFLDFLQVGAFHFYQLSVLLACFVFVHFAQTKKDQWQLYPALGIITMLIFSFIYTSNFQYVLFFLALISSLYYFVPGMLRTEKSINGFGSNQVLVFSFQFLILLIASFGGFWEVFSYRSEDSMSIFQIILITLICIGILIQAFKLKELLFTHNNSLFTNYSFFVPVFILFGCLSGNGLQHLYTIILLVTGIVMLVYAARNSNLVVANLSIGMIGLVMLCRFLDLNMSLTVKGVLFILIGSFFFLANYLIIKNKNHENSK